QVDALAEQIVEIDRSSGSATAVPRMGASAACLMKRMAVAVVLCTFFGVAENRVRLLHLLEPFGGRLVVGFDVGVILSRKFAIHLADLIRRGVAIDAEDLVEIVGHQRKKRGPETAAVRGSREATPYGGPIKSMQTPRC